jgi:hypothetical protein
MKIVKRGKDPKEIVWRGDCSKCGSTIEAKRGELVSIEYDQRENGEFGRATCPVCGHGMVFYPKESM